MLIVFYQLRQNLQLFLTVVTMGVKSNQTFCLHGLCWHLTPAMMTEWPPVVWDLHAPTGTIYDLPKILKAISNLSIFLVCSFKTEDTSWCGTSHARVGRQSFPVRREVTSLPHHVARENVWDVKQRSRPGVWPTWLSWDSRPVHVLYRISHIHHMCWPSVEILQWAVQWVQL